MKTMMNAKGPGENGRKRDTESGDNGATAKPKRAKVNNILPKTQGFLIGHNLPEKKRNRAASEALAILEEYALRNPKKYKAGGESCRFTHKSLHSIKLKKRIFIESDIDDPSVLVNDIFTDLKSTQTRKTQFCLRFQPAAVCTSECSDMVGTAKPLLKSVLVQHHQAVNYMFHGFDVEGEKKKFCDEVRKYVTSLGSPDEVVAKCDPELVMEVRLQQGFCFISVMENYNKFSKYNIANIVPDDNAMAPNTNVNSVSQQPIRSGLRGFLVSKRDTKADNDEVASEAIKILNVYSDTSYKADGGTCAFQKKSIQVDNLVFLSTDIDDPSALVHDIYTDLLTSDEPKTEEVTFCRSILPVFTCKRKFNPIVSSVKKFIKPIFVEPEEEETLKYKITYKGYFPDKLSKTKIGEELKSYLTSNIAHKECGNPDVEILIQNIGQISYISVLPNHNIFKGYNMAAIIDANKQALEEDGSSEEETDDGMDEDEDVDNDGDENVEESESDDEC